MPRGPGYWILSGGQGPFFCPCGAFFELGRPLGRCRSGAGGRALGPDLWPGPGGRAYMVARWPVFWALVRWLLLVAGGPVAVLAGVGFVYCWPGYLKN